MEYENIKEKKLIPIIIKNRLIIIKIILVIIISFSYYILLHKSKKINENNFLTKDIIRTYYFLFQRMRELVNNQRFYKDTNKYIKNDNLKKKGVGICAIGKKENLYAREYVEYYQKLGIKKIIIYDNNDINGERFIDVLGDYIKSNFVDLFEVRGLESVQMPLYNICYQTYKNQFDYIAFLDFDEYIAFNDNNLKNINDYIYDKKLQKCESIVLNWRDYGDSDIVKYDSRPMIEKFNKNYIDSTFGKSIVSTNLPNLLIFNVHVIGQNKENFCNSKGEKLHVHNIFYLKLSKRPKAYIKHFFTKSAEEFCIKLGRGYGQLNKNSPKYFKKNKNRIREFFDVNKITKEKIDIIENCSGIKLDIYREKMNNK